MSAVLNGIRQAVPVACSGKEEPPPNRASVKETTSAHQIIHHALYSEQPEQPPPENRASSAKENRLESDPAIYGTGEPVDLLSLILLFKTSRGDP